jgi:large subunit ribosomal protein L19
MSAALTCTRATAPRALLRSHRFASTEAVAAGAERVMTLRPKTPSPTPAKTSTATTTTTAALTPKRTTAPTLAERMHRALYPEMYPNGQPVGVEKSRKPKETMSGVKSTPRPFPTYPPTCLPTHPYLRHATRRTS